MNAVSPHIIPKICPISGATLVLASEDRFTSIRSLPDIPQTLQNAEKYLLTEDGLLAYAIMGGISRILPQLAISLEALTEVNSVE